MKLKVFVSHYNNESYIYSDDFFVPIQVWKLTTKLDFWIDSDNTWDSITHKNSWYAELTTQYWVWKNYDLTNLTHVGFCHYRRYFSFKKNIFSLLSNIHIFKFFGSLNYNIINKKFIKKILKKNNSFFISSIGKEDFDVCLPRSLFLKKSSIKENYYKFHIKDTWDIMKKTLLNLYPDYEQSFNEAEEANRIYICNMFVMKKEYFIEYNERLFPLLFKLENIFQSMWLEFTWYQSRVYGYLAERLLNVWLIHKQKEKRLKLIESNMLFLK